MKAIKMIACILGFIVLGITAGFTGFWLAQDNQEMTQVTQVTQETQETQVTQTTQETQEVDPWENWQEPTTVKFEGEDILINNGQGLASQLRWVLVDEEPTLVVNGNNQPNMLEWTVQFEDGKFGKLVLDRQSNEWQLTKGVN